MYSADEHVFYLDIPHLLCISISTLTVMPGYIYIYSCTLFVEFLFCHFLFDIFFFIIRPIFRNIRSHYLLIPFHPVNNLIIPFPSFVLFGMLVFALVTKTSLNDLRLLATTWSFGMQNWPYFIRRHLQLNYLTISHLP